MTALAAISLAVVVPSPATSLPSDSVLDQPLGASVSARRHDFAGPLPRGQIEPLGRPEGGRRSLAADSEPFIEATMSADPVQGTQDRIVGYDFAAATSVTLTIDTGSGPIAVPDPPTTDADGTFVYDPPELDLLSGDVVVASDGSSSASLTLVGITFDAIDFDQDTAVGTTDQPSGTEVGVVAANDSGAEEVLVVASFDQRWSVQFTLDITPAFSFWAFVLDPDLDGATVAEPPVPAQLQASTAHDPTTGPSDWIAGFGFAPDTEISLIVRGAMISDRPVSDESGNFLYDGAGTLDLRSGDRVTATDGVSVRRLTVVGLSFDELDYGGDVATGTSDQADGTDVSVELVLSPGTTERVDSIVIGGEWSAAFDGDVTTEARGDAFIFDSDWDLTVATSPEPPQVHASMANSPAEGSPDFIAGYLFTPDAVVDLRVNGVSVADPPAADSEGSFGYETADLDLVAGDVVDVSDGTVAKSLTLVSLTVDSLDYVADTASGTSDQPDGTVVDAVIAGETDILEYASALVSSGTWTVSFASDLLPEFVTGAFIGDSDWDRTIAISPPPPVIRASMANDPDAPFPTPPRPDRVAGTRFAAATTLELRINGVPVADPPTTDEQGSFWYETQGLDLANGDEIEVTDGDTTRRFTLPTLTFDVLDHWTFTAAGTSSKPDGTPVYVQLSDGGTDVRHAAMVTGGAWSIEILTDLRLVTWAEASTVDHDGDAAVAPYNFPLPARPGDFDGDGSTDPAVYRDGAWFIEGMATQYLGLAGDVPVPADYAAEQHVRPAVFRHGPWFVSGQETLFYGLPGDIPVPGDYWPDDTAERGLYRRGTWFLTGSSRVYLGLAGDVPVPADYDGDRRLEPAVFREGRWFVQDEPVIFFGLAGDVPVPGDYDGDGDAEPAVFREGRWFVWDEPVIFFGLAGDVPVPGDYDGDGDVEPAVYRGGQWHIHGQPTRYLGLPGDQPVILPAAIYDSYY